MLRARSGNAAARLAATSEAWQMLSGLLQAAQVMPAELAAPDGSIPLTILGGFLGAGKTTLLNRLLAEPGGRRIAVLVNDFGRINIDAALVSSRTDDMISLANGCACCTVAADLTRTLIDLAQRPLPPEAIVLEASGLADPRGIAQVALANPALRLDGVLTLVDALDFAQSRQVAETAEPIHRQIDAADLVVLTKTDAASAGQIEAARALLGEHYPAKRVIAASHGDLPADVVLGVHSGRDPRHEPAVPWDHAAGFQSWSLQSAAPLDRSRLQAFLSRVAPGLLRAKGVLWFADDPRRHVYQQVGARSSLVPDVNEAIRANGESESTDTTEATVSPASGRPSVSSLVLIGLKGRFDAGRLREEFEQIGTPASCRQGDRDALEP